MADYRAIYAHQAELYDALVRYEDHEGNVRRALDARCPCEGLEVVEVGAGTGRLTALVAGRAKRVRAFDASPAMLAVARARLAHVAPEALGFEVADNRALPLPDRCADLCLAGWTFGHATGWYPDRWREEVNAALDEFLRVLRPGGVAVVLETLGTGRTEPAPPSERLARFYELLERERGFSRVALRTDYRFPDAATAERCVRGFFGDAMADALAGGVALPECTGLWSRYG